MKFRPKKILFLLFNPKTRTPRSLVVFLLLVFPPLAWVFMWRDRTYHHWFVKILIISGIISLLFLAYFYFAFYLQVPGRNNISLRNTDEALLITVGMILGAISALLQILFALYLHRLFKKNGYLSHIQLTFITIFLLVNIYISTIAPLIIIDSVYDLFFPPQPLSLTP